MSTSSIDDLGDKKLEKTKSNSSKMTDAKTAVELTATSTTAPPAFSSIVPNRSVVTPQRKEELLLKARAERRQWIEKVSLPYDPKLLREHREDHTNNIDGQNDGNMLWTLPISSISSSNNTLTSLYKIKSSLVCQKYLPSATATISELYGLPTISTTSFVAATSKDIEGFSKPMSTFQIAERVEQLVQPYLTEVDPHTRSDLDEVAESNLSEKGNDTTNNNIVEAYNMNDPKILEPYQEFCSSLFWPESAVLVQGMKNLVFHWIQTYFGNDQSGHVSMDAAASALNTYCQSTYDSLIKIDNNTTNRRLPTSQESLRRSLESFMYGQVREIIEKEINKSAMQRWDKESSALTMTTSQFEERLQLLQFVQPSHLEIACLTDDSENNEDMNGLSSLVKDPMNALLSMTFYHSPYEKLQRILKMYRGVNLSLSTAMKRDATIKSSQPSADDVLPTIILICIKAQPHNLLQDLQFIETFALPEYLRGEAGYAYTNLYGAVQFLQDLDLDSNDGSSANSSSHLSISPEELKQNLEESRARINRHREGLSSTTRGPNRLGDNSQNNNDVLPSMTKRKRLSVRDIRAARLGGKDVNLELANTISQLDDEETTSKTASHISLDPAARSYTFLGAHPDQLKFSDVPKLFEEYQKLVEITSHLLDERSARNAIEKKKAAMARQKALGERLLLSEES